MRRGAHVSGIAGMLGLLLVLLSSTGCPQPQEPGPIDLSSLTPAQLEGLRGPQGLPGGQGAAGVQGQAGISCWDTDFDGVGDPVEDRNGDGNFNALDCLGAPGAAGATGVAGRSCWDLNGDGAGSSNEDRNGDGNFDALDCQGAQGTQGQQGAQGDQGAQGAPGLNGISCWDSNGNRVADPAEDTNGDGDFNGLDCRGATGPAGAAGRSCWDLNGDGVATPGEDANGDGDFDALDCQGPQGPAGADGAPGAPGQDGDQGPPGPPGNPGAPGADGEDLTGVVGRGVVRASGDKESGDEIVSSSLLEQGIYRVVVSLNAATQLPASKDDFAVLITLEAITSEPGGEGEVGLLFPYYLIDSMNSQTKQLSIRVFIVRFDPATLLVTPNNAEFSILVLEP